MTLDSTGKLDSEDFDRELGRVVDRLNTMPLTKVATARDEVMSCARVLAAEGRRLGVAVPPGTTLPEIDPHAFGSMISVLGGDVLAAADSPEELVTSTAALTDLRRALP